MERVLTPLLMAFAKLMLARGVLFPAFVDAMKQAYVAAAQDGDGPSTDSQISLATGLQRRDIARLREGRDDVDPRPNPLSNLVAAWQAVQGYHANDCAVILPQNGPAPSFEALAKSIRKDVHPRTLLNALLDAGTVHLEDGKVTLLQTSYQPHAGSLDQLEYLACNVGDHLRTATLNLSAGHAPSYDRAVHYSHLSTEAIAELSALFETRQQAVLEDLNIRAAALQRSSAGSLRFRAGGYFFDEDKDRETL